MKALGNACVIFSMALVLLLAGAPVPSEAQEAQKIRIVGCRYMYFTMTDYARVYSEKNPNVHVMVASNDEAEAFSKFLAKQADAFMAFRMLEKDEKAELAEAGIRLIEQPVGWGAVALVVHPQNPLNELTIDQVRQIFLGNITNWKQVGGPDERIVPMTREESLSGTEVFFRETVLKGSPFSQQTLRILDHDVVRAVKQQKGGIADARFFEAVRGRIKGLVKLLAVKEDDAAPAILPTDETLKNRTYPISGQLYLYYGVHSGNGHADKFVQFCLERGIGARYSKIDK